MELEAYGENQGSSGTGSVLVVDDSPINLRIMEKLFVRLNVTVATAASGNEALEKIPTMEYDMIFVDYQMPGMDGIEVLHAIRSMPGEYYRKVPMIALTANETEEAGAARERFLAEGFDEFLRKPLTAEVVEPVLKRFFCRENETENETAGMPEHANEEQEAWEERLAAIGLDVKTALLYCSGKASYLEILQDYCKAKAHIKGELQHAFAQKDWENYTIAVHGIKGVMRSVGATELSEEARKLERAGRTGEWEYIVAYHRDFMGSYDALFLKLEEQLLFGEGEKYGQDSGHAVQKEDGGTLQELQEDALGTMLEAMEDAAYGWEIERFLGMITELKNYQYKGVPLAECVDTVQRKLQKSDYLSAVEAMWQWKQRQ